MHSWVKNLHIETYGSEIAEPILLLHGWGSNAGLMRPLALALQEQYHVYNIDLPGHGQTPLPPEPWGVPEHAKLVQAFIEQEINQKTHIVGHSNGGRISLYMASNPELATHIHSLSLISPSGIKSKRTLKYHLKKGLATTLKAPFKFFPPGLQSYGLDWLRHTLIWQLLGSSDYSQLHGIMREVFVKTVNFHLEDRLKDIHVPTLLFWGDKDTAISAYQMEIMVRNIEGSKLIKLKGATHYGYLDQLNTVVAQLRQFLSLHPIAKAASGQSILPESTLPKSTLPD